MPTLQRFPLYCDFREVVVGMGFAAGVEVHARVIAEQEKAGWWVYGVTPAAIADSGATLAEAVTNFRWRLKAVLFDFAHDSKDVEAFRALVSRFFKETDGATEREWDEARAAVRAGRVDMPGIHKERANRDAGVRVVLLKFRPTENVLDGRPTLAA